MNNTQKQANANFFESSWALLRIGGTWTWADKSHIFTKMSSGKMSAKTMTAWRDLKEITPRGWAKANCSLQRPTTTHRDVGSPHQAAGLNVSREELIAAGARSLSGTTEHPYGITRDTPLPTHTCPKCNQEYETTHHTKDLAKLANNNTSIEQWCSGICGDECWNACSEAEIIQHKFLRPRYTASGDTLHFINPRTGAERVVRAGGTR